MVEAFSPIELNTAVLVASNVGMVFYFDYCVSSFGNDLMTRPLPSAHPNPNGFMTIRYPHPKVRVASRMGLSNYHLK